MNHKPPLTPIVLLSLAVLSPMAGAHPGHNLAESPGGMTHVLSSPDHVLFIVLIVLTAIGLPLLIWRLVRRKRRSNSTCT